MTRAFFGVLGAQFGKELMRRIVAFECAARQQWWNSQCYRRMKQKDIVLPTYQVHETQI
jgi:hypothetical protein